jgi:hypothetical protein
MLLRNILRNILRGRVDFWIGLEWMEVNPSGHFMTTRELHLQLLEFLPQACISRAFLALVVLTIHLILIDIYYYNTYYSLIIKM